MTSAFFGFAKNWNGNNEIVKKKKSLPLLDSIIVEIENSEEEKKSKNEGKFSNDPLHNAIRREEVKVVESLLSSDENLLNQSKEDEEEDKKSYLYHACGIGNVEIIRLILKHCKDINRSLPLHKVILSTKKNEIEIVKVILSWNGIDPNLCDNRGRTPLILAIRLNRVDIVAELLKNHEVLDKLNCPFNRKSAALHSIELKNKEIFHLILDTLRFNPNQRINEENENSDTLALRVLLWDQEIFSKMLRLYHEISLHCINGLGHSVLTLAVHYKMDESVELITNYIKLWGKGGVMKEDIEAYINQEDDNIAKYELQLAELKEKIEKCKKKKIYINKGKDLLNQIAKRKWSDTSVDENDLTCPITNEIMRDPVIAADGHSYERSAIQSWFDNGKHTSPLTNEKLPTKRLFPNLRLKSTIRTFNEITKRE